MAAALALWAVLPPSPAVADDSAAFDPVKTAEIEAGIAAAVERKEIPGGVVLIEHNGRQWGRAVGYRMVDPVREPVKPDTIYDAASLTKVMATAPSIMLLAEDGKIDVSAPASRWLPEFRGDGRETITVMQLLTHTSGLKAGLPRELVWSGYGEGVAQAMALAPGGAPGKAFVYSDINFILLGEIVRRVSGEPLDVFARKRIYEPLGMKDTTFNPPASLRDRIAPTTREANGLVHGVVHDPTIRRMGGVGGSAGLFTTAADVAKFCRMLLARGRGPDGRVVMKPETVRLFTSPQPGLPGVRRTPGFDMASPFSDPKGRGFGPSSFGHTGWTGTSLWVDPDARAFVILLTNRNHPTEAGKTRELRHRTATLAAEAMGLRPVAGQDPPPPSPAPASRADVRQGIDRLVAENFATLKGLRVGLVTNQTGRDSRSRTTIDLLHEAPDVQLVSLFSPEHGIRGDLDHERIDDTRDAKTGLPVYSLYSGPVRRPKQENLAGLDALVFDIQDIGCRFYTYISTMLYCMEEAAKAGIRFVVLDRINPIGGVTVDGPVLTGETTFVGCHPIPVRHGMTIGELAKLFVQDRKLSLNLTVVPVEGWSRAEDWPATNLPWVNPSPNMRSPDAAVLYPGIGLLEFTNLSVGRGTEAPFQFVGAPWIDATALADLVNQENLPGILIEPAAFTPEASVFANELCRGVRITVLDRAAVRSVRTGLSIARALQKLYPGTFQIDPLSRLLFHPPTLDAIRAGATSAEIEALWQADLDSFRKRRAAVLLYPEPVPSGEPN